MNKGFVTITLASALAVPALVHAGVRYNNEVTVDAFYKIATGSMGAAYNSDDANQRIDCWIYAAKGSAFTSGGCMAVDRENHSAYCTFYNHAPFATVVSAMSNDSFITFQWDDSYHCTYINAGPSSTVGPKR